MAEGELSIHGLLLLLVLDFDEILRGGQGRLWYLLRLLILIIFYTDIRPFHALRSLFILKPVLNVISFLNLKSTNFPLWLHYLIGLLISNQDFLLRKVLNQNLIFPRRARYLHYLDPEWTLRRSCWVSRARMMSECFGSRWRRKEGGVEGML